MSASTDTLTERLLSEAVVGCCRNESWRGHLCGYHQGFEDGMDAYIDAFAGYDPGAPSGDPETDT